MPIEFKSSEADKTRPCPSCRMMISILATRCRYCGELVGRPKDETRHMTVNDLGGETVKHYATSASVMDALEAFRSEEEMRTSEETERATSQKRSFLKRKKKAGEVGADKQATDHGIAGLPDLDERSMDLAGIVGSKETPKPKRRSPYDPSWIKRAGVFAALVAVMVVSYMGVVQVSAMLKSRNGGIVDELPKLPNPAEDILATGGASIDALKEAVKAQDLENVSHNRRVTLKAREKVVEDVSKLLNATPFDMAKLEQASALANKAHDLDPCDATRILKKEVDEEWAAYNMVLQSVNPDEGTATFSLDKGLRDLNEPGKVATVREGDDENLLRDRFKVFSVRRGSVTLLDTKRKNRHVIFDTTGNVR